MMLRSFASSQVFRRQSDIDTHDARRRADDRAPSADNWLKSLLPFVVMCIGMFIALLDIQIVASSLQDIGGGLSAAQDEISWVQTGLSHRRDHRDSRSLAG